MKMLDKMGLGLGGEMPNLNSSYTASSSNWEGVNEVQIPLNKLEVQLRGPTNSFTKNKRKNLKTGNRQTSEIEKMSK